MLIEEIRKIKSGRKELVSFGKVMGIALAILGVLFLWREKRYSPYFFALAVIFAGSGLRFPTVLKPFHKVWMTLAILLGWVMTHVLLTLMFYLVFTPLGLLMRLLRKQTLNLEWGNPKETYWIHRERKPFDPKQCEKQF